MILQAYLSQALLQLSPATMVAMSVVAFWQKFKRIQWIAIITVGLVGAFLLGGLVRLPSLLSE
jgi:hypothetical protein